ncbi:MAG: hypothetical protein WGN25_05715 [Candidatus Electrothrix sp. GW3-4]|uniref:hypothetical protein n=1 Tax=Candidatus Electrothrix sp. GW3-4 TaxID=3126740 RepID=UPI0030D1589A
MKNIKIFVGATLLFIIVLFGITVAIIPLLLSSDWAKNSVVSKVNSSSSGKLALGDCAIGWSEGLKCTEVSYHDQGYQVDAAHLTGTQGLFSLLMAPKNLGTITVDDPVVVIAQPQAKPGSEDETLAAQTDSRTPAKTEDHAKETSNSEKETGKPGTWFWHKMRGKILLNRAIVKLQQGAQEPQMLVQEGALDLTLASDTLKLNLVLATGAEQTGGEVKAVGTAHLPSVKGDLLDLMTADMQVTFTDVQLAPFLALAPAEGSVPQGQAILASELTVKNTEGGNLVLRGPITLEKVDLTGGFLAEDHPRLDQLAFELHIQRDEQKEWRLPELKMLSDFGSVGLQSSYGKQGLQATGEGKFDLPVLLTQLPGLFKVQENLRLENGRASLAFEVAEKDKVMQLSAEATVEDLEGRQNRQPFVWKSPLRLSLKGSMAGKEPEVDRLALQADFLDIEGQGNLHHFTLKGTADLDQAMQEISRIIQFDWDVGGRLKLDLETTKDSEERYTVDAKVDIADYRLSMKNKEVLPVHQFRFNGKLVAPGYFPKAKAEAADLTFDLSSWAGDLTGALSGVYRDQGQVMAHYQLDADILLARVTELLHRFDALEQETSMAGDMKLQTTGYTEKDRLVVSTLDSRIKGFILYRQGKILQDPELSLFTTKPEPTPNVEEAVRALEKAESKDAFFAQGGYNLIDTKNHRLVLRNLSLNSGFADIRVEKIFLDDWQQKPAPAIKALQVNGRSDLAKLTTLLQQLGAMQPEQKFAGDAIFSLDLAERKEDIKIAGSTSRGNSGTVKLDIDHFSYSKIGKKVRGKKGQEELLIERQKLVFRSRLHGDLTAGDVQFTTFDIESAPLSLQADGEFQLSGKKPHFSLDGQATPDLASLVAILNGMYPLGIEATGKKKEKFTLYYPLAPEEKENAKINLRFATKVYADSFSRSGIDVSRLTLDTDMKQGVMDSVLKGTLNDGWLQLSPRIDYTQTPPLLTMAEGEQVLTDVHLEEALTEGILKGIHPVFGSLATPAGIINVRLDRFSLPLEEKGMEKIDFKVFLDLTGVALEPKGVLSSILEVAGYVDSTLTMKNKSMTCEGVQGQVSCTPIKMIIADSEMIISGSAGMDGSLEYIVEVPVTKRLLGKKGYELLKGTTLKVPIKGTKDKPVYSRDALMRASSDLLKQAAGQATKNVLREQVDKVVPDLLDNLFGK